ncbi:DUF496 family protein [Buchnera aphidicola]|uniref:DUF496 family protein n=1 Tax=Buchnera aphidicola TaxID=9 RepID=UPI002236F387|nr:DUF496 family protein [Buchnera aphidicola]MCW5197454.1 DUF496 family protein [Buchnera aphidicola (Chaitophorus viminalis)]
MNTHNKKNHDNQNSPKSFKNVLHVVHLFRRKNKLKREMNDLGKKIRDNQKRILLIKNLNDYIKPDMKYQDIKKIILSMKNDYEDRIDDYVLQCADISKEKKKITHELKFIGITKKK